jgi:hypothetical protein
MGQATRGAPSAESLVFAPGVAEKLQAYVYLLVDPRDELIFYVGKGRKNRGYDHARAALGPDVDEDRKHLKLHTIQAIQAAGLAVRIEILRHGLDDEQALMVEAAAIDLVRRLGDDVPVANLQRGHEVTLGLATVEQLAARYAAKTITITDPLLLIRPKNLWWRANNDRDRYEATRGWWRIGARSRGRVEHAAAVVDGIIRAVWKIDGWEDDPSSRRAAFVGNRDAALEEKYVWGDVSDLLPRGAQNPVHYIIPSTTQLTSHGAD